MDKAPKKLDYFRPDEDRVSVAEVVLLAFLLLALAVVILLMFLSR